MMPSKPKPPYMNQFQKEIFSTTKARYQHLRFFRLSVGEYFQRGKFIVKKVGAFSAEDVAGDLFRVMPWTRVRTTRFVKHVASKKTSRMQATYTGKHPFAYADADAKTTAQDIVTKNLSVESLEAIRVIGGDRTPESIGGTEKTPSS